MKCYGLYMVFNGLCRIKEGCFGWKKLCKEIIVDICKLFIYVKE